MILLRVLVFVALAVMVIYWLRRKRRSTRGSELPKTEALAQCAHCNVRFPATEAVTAEHKVYCCEAHRAAAARAE